MIRVKIILKYEDRWMAESLYRACLQEAVSEPRSGVRARVDGNRLLVFFKSSNPSKIAERIRRFLSLLNMAEQAARLLSLSTSYKSLFPLEKYVFKHTYKGLGPDNVSRASSPAAGKTV